LYYSIKNSLIKNKKIEEYRKNLEIKIKTKL